MTSQRFRPHRRDQRPRYVALRPKSPSSKRRAPVLNRMEIGECRSLNLPSSGVSKTCSGPSRPRWRRLPLSFRKEESGSPYRTRLHSRRSLTKVRRHTPDMDPSLLRRLRLLGGIQCTARLQLHKQANHIDLGYRKRTDHLLLGALFEPRLHQKLAFLSRPVHVINRMRTAGVSTCTGTSSTPSRYRQLTPGPKLSFKNITGASSRSPTARHITS